MIRLGLFPPIAIAWRAGEHDTNLPRGRAARIAEGPTDHIALGVGPRARTIQKMADVLGLEGAIVSAGA